MPTDEKPSSNEEKYFAEENQRLTREMRARLDAQRAAHAALRPTMYCPKCQGALVEIEHEHVRIDRCEGCGGVWLDKGELEMLEHRQSSGARGFLDKMFGR